MEVKWMLKAMRLTRARWVLARVLNRPIPAASMGSVELEGPMPNTIYVDKGAEFIAEGADIDLTPESLEF